MPQRYGKKKRKEVSKERMERTREQAVYDALIPEDLIRRAEKDAMHSKYLTPYLVACKYGIKVSTARKLLRILHERGIVVPYNYNRRVPIYVPSRRKP